MIAHGVVHLAAVMHWFSRRVPAWRVSIAMDVGFCLDAVNVALARHGPLETFNTDQGSQSTRGAFAGRPEENVIRIRMDGCGTWCDNVFVEWL